MPTEAETFDRRSAVALSSSFSATARLEVVAGSGSGGISVFDIREQPQMARAVNNPVSSVDNQRIQ